MASDDFDTLSLADTIYWDKLLHPQYAARLDFPSLNVQPLEASFPHQCFENSSRPYGE